MSRETTIAQAEPKISKETARKVVWALAAPTLIEMVLMSLTGMADMIQVGRISPEAITSVGLTNQPIMLLRSILQALNIGTVALVARFIGMGDIEEASNTLKQTFVVTLILGSIISLFAGLSAAPILRFMGAEPEVVTTGAGYFQVVGFGFIFSSIAMAIAAVLRGAGDTRTPLTVNLWANVINVILNWVLIWGKFGFPQWGVFGAGVATAFSRAVAAMWFLIIILKGDKKVQLDFSTGYKFDFDILKRVYNVGVSAAVEQIVLRTGQIMFAKVISSLGTVVYAAHQVAMNINSLTFMPGMAFATAATTLVGQNLGAEKPDDAELCANTTRNMGMSLAVSISVAFILFGKYITSLYSDDLNVIMTSALVLRVYALAQPFQSTQFIMAGGLRGAGDTRYPLYSTATGMWFGRVLLGWFFAHVMNMGLLGAWIGMTIDQVVRGVLIQLRFSTGKWKSLKV